MRLRCGGRCRRVLRLTCAASSRMTDCPRLSRRALAEGLAAFALVFAGAGAIVADTAYDGALGTVGIALVFRLIVMTMVYATGHLSGAHITQP
jgi:glycerol uptake facilitator-like aquaporin